VIVETHLFFTGMTLLIFAIFLSRRSPRRAFGDTPLLSDKSFGQGTWDSLSLELGAQLFSAEDLEFVGRCCTREFKRRFQEERTALALEWLVEVRKEIGRAMREHAKVAGLSPTLRTVDELKLALEFALFQVSNRVLYCAVWLYGPSAAGNLVRYSTRLAGELKGLLDSFLHVRAADVEVLGDDSKRSIPS